MPPGAAERPYGSTSKQQDISTSGAGRGSDITLGEPVDQEDEANGIFRRSALTEVNWRSIITGGNPSQGCAASAERMPREVLSPGLGNLALIKLEKQLLRSDIAGDLHSLHRMSEADL